MALRCTRYILWRRSIIRGGVVGDSNRVERLISVLTSAYGKPMSMKKRRCSALTRHTQCLRGQRGRHLYLIAAAPLGHVHGCVRLRNEVFTPDTQRVAGGDTDAAGQANWPAEPLHTYACNP